MKRTKNRVLQNFMIDPDLLAEFNACFPGLSKSAQITIAIKKFIDDVKTNIITSDSVLAEMKRVNDRRIIGITKQSEE